MNTPSPPTPPGRSSAHCSSVLVPLLCLAVFGLYTWTAAPTAYWLDSSELAAGAFELGIPHPPGHPLFVLIGKAATLLPIGSIAFRVHVLCAILTSLAVGAVALVSARIWNGAGLLPATFIAAAMAVTIPFWFHGVRAEVYSLHLVLALVLLVASHLASTTTGRQYWALFGFATGLALTNHHYLTLFLAPAVLWLLLSEKGSRRVFSRRIPLVALGLLYGLTPYLLIPIRSGAFPTVRWGQGDSLGGFLWVVTARAFQKTASRVTRTDPASMFQRLGGFLGHNLGLILLILAAIGLVLLWRRRVRLAIGLVLLLAANLATQVLFDFDATNPDVAGYFLLSLWILGLLAVGPLAALAAWTKKKTAVAHHLSLILAFVLALLSASLALPASIERACLSTYRDTDRFAQAIYAVTPTGGLLVTSFFETIFNLWYRDTAQCQRPDVSVVHRLFRTYPGYDGYLRHRFPELADGLGPEGRRGELDATWLIRQSTTRAVLIEPDNTLQTQLRPNLLPLFLLTQLAPFPVPSKPWPKPIEMADRAFWNRFFRQIHPYQRETMGNLLWLFYHHAHLLMEQGQWSAGSDYLSRALALSPEDPDLLALEAQLPEEAAPRYSWAPKNKNPHARAEGLKDPTTKEEKPRLE